MRTQASPDPSGAVAGCRAGAPAGMREAILQMFGRYAWSLNVPVGGYSIFTGQDADETAYSVASPVRMSAPGRKRTRANVGYPSMLRFSPHEERCRHRQRDR